MVASLFGAGVIPRDMRVGFGRPLEEPMLWIPDAVAGAVGSTLRGGETYTLGPNLSLVRVDIT